MVAGSRQACLITFLRSPCLWLSLSSTPYFSSPLPPPVHKHTKHNLGNQQSLCLDVLTSLTHKPAPAEQSL